MVAFVFIVLSLITQRSYTMKQTSDLPRLEVLLPLAEDWADEKMLKALLADERFWKSPEKVNDRFVELIEGPFREDEMQQKKKAKILNMMISISQRRVWVGNGSLHIQFYPYHPAKMYYVSSVGNKPWKYGIAPVTLLYMALYHDNFYAARVLLEHGADPNAPNPSNWAECRCPMRGLSRPWPDNSRAKLMADYGGTIEGTFIKESELQEFNKSYAKYWNGLLKSPGMYTSLLAAELRNELVNFMPKLKSAKKSE